ncbi:DegV family protein [Lacticaseibacillus thailandensis]|uniref:Degv family protein n=1 Tax=Lacticaseibacillus thailandensis DSM 22698 = JCM 13996 TaxID=1423810 RepID=A0A0R2C6A6_9LACO|nr:DegV family protein [Lacticaseibacillus thailandensis]KRM87160.1 degv family protein [Lacticaseibacillus thailandensis DSM 22698 = JCM 13996]
MKIAIVTDSTAYITPEQIGDLPIRVATTPVIIDGTTYNEGVDITTSEYYAHLKTAKEFPHTSQPRLGDVIDIHHQLLAEGYDTVINIYLSATISGINSTVSALARETTDQHIIVYDSQITVILMGEMVLTAGRMAAAGASVDEIIHQLDILRASTGEYFIVNDLQHLVRGGRLSNTAGILGSMLRIKPLLTFDDTTHKIVVADKVRTLPRAYRHVETLFAQAQEDADYPLRAWVIDGNDPQAGDDWQHSLQQQFPDVRIQRSYFGPAIGTHLGAKAIALAWMRDLHQD